MAHSQQEHVKPLFNLRVLLRYDEKYSVHVAQCLETGNLVTADSSEDARLMIKELLEDEINFAVTNDNLKNLFSSPAPFEVLVQWLAAAEKGSTLEFLDVNLKELELRHLEPKNAVSRSSRLEFAQAA